MGSIKLHFDESLLTNEKKPTGFPFHDKNYATLTELEGAFWKYPVRKKNLGKSMVDAVNPDELLSVDEHLAEFDIKDMVDATGRSDKADFVYSGTEESQLQFNVMNSFKTEVESASGDDKVH